MRVVVDIMRVIMIIVGDDDRGNEKHEQILFFKNDVSFSRRSLSSIVIKWSSNMIAIKIFFSKKKKKWTFYVWMVYVCVWGTSTLVCEILFFFVKIFLNRKGGWEWNEKMMMIGRLVGWSMVGSFSRRWLPSNQFIFFKNNAQGKVWWWWWWLW